jgi:hypothetical protein
MLETWADAGTVKTEAPISRAKAQAAIADHRSIADILQAN